MKNNYKKISANDLQKHGILDHHILKKLYITYLYERNYYTRNYIKQREYPKKIHRLEKSIDLIGWSISRNATWRYPHYDNIQK